MRTAAAALGTALLLGACAAPTACPPGTTPAALAEAIFGRNRDGALRVSEADWDRFLAEEVTPRFPDGLTVLDARGQWRGADARPEREPAKLLLLVLPGTTPAEAAARLEPVAAAYRTRFDQESVLRVLQQGCAAF
ncbi:DUF3574 domain-containing protein [Roseomonas sp. BN140053]|uniref:DUF3574 domain-containing protein n=1 Tax=Roseomonas sp. BN140053 TaxID=3391898 RepID=UPI0039E92D1A